ncbi:hypothetical protein PR048_023718 [Dryococelus australis]|uniref:DDE Tnp4 domain-containing protein n=1 Tax=Dryococelus australis TaxID=614101 RepID=A0ABQ9GUX0_9NEOP|nr:hypothetical protein PR048_023718 [Dryococelus australis]
MDEAVYAAFAISVIKRRQNWRVKRKRKYWSKDRLLKGGQYSHTNIMEELKVFLQDRHNYIQLLRMVAPLIEKKTTNMRDAITPHERLRYLATGRSLEDLKFSTIISSQAFEDIIEETCVAIYKVLKRDYCKVGNNVLTQGYNLNNILDRISTTIKISTGKFLWVLQTLITNSYFIFGKNGRVSDGGVLSHCDFYEKLSNQSLHIPEPSLVDGYSLPCVLIGDNAFLLQEDVMKTFSSKPLTQERRVCNYRFSRGRRKKIVFGIMTARFVVFACCALHNFLRIKTSTYTPPVCFDTESNEIGTVIPRMQRDPLARLRVNNTGALSNTALHITHLFVEYFCGRDRVPWQERFAFLICTENTHRVFANDANYPTLSNGLMDWYFGLASHPLSPHVSVRFVGSHSPRSSLMEIHQSISSSV